MLANISFPNIQNDVLKSKLVLICELSKQLDKYDFLIMCCKEHFEFKNGGISGSDKDLEHFEIRKNEIETQLKELVK